MRKELYVVFMEFLSFSELITNVGQLPARHAGSGKPSKISSEIKQIVEVQMRFDNEHATAPSANKQRLQHFTKNYLAV